MSESPSTTPIPLKELLPAAAGVAIGIGIIAFFVGLAFVMNMPLLVNHANVPHQ